MVWDILDERYVDSANPLGPRFQFFRTRVITPAELRAVVPELEGLPGTTLERIAAMVIRRRYAKGAILYRAGDPADGLYIVLAGRVRVSRETSAHTEFLHVETAGGVLGEIPMFGGGPFPATASAAEPTICAHLDHRAVERLLAEDPAFARFALRRLAERAYLSTTAATFQNQSFDCTFVDFLAASFVARRRSPLLAVHDDYSLLSACHFEAPVKISAPVSVISATSSMRTPPQPGI